MVGFVWFATLENPVPRICDVEMEYDSAENEVVRKNFAVPPQHQTVQHIDCGVLVRWKLAGTRAQVE